MELFVPVRSDVAESIVASGVFDALVDADRDRLLDAFDGVRLVTGETLMEQGDVGDALYVVRHGRLRTLVADATGHSVEVGQVGKGEIVGEMALLTDEPRAATVIAMRDTELFRLPAAAFELFTSGHPQLMRPFAGVVVGRLRDALTSPPRPTLPATIVLLPTPGAAIAELATALAERLSGYRTAIVGAAAAADQDNPAAWLLDLENDVDVSLLIADDTPTAWTRQCLRHADRVFLVAEERRSPAKTSIEADPQCAARLAELPVELVMSYRRHASSSAWLAGREMKAHHNLREGSSEDIMRLVRRLTGSASVLALGGGGARGFAHLGVIRALLEADIPIDAIVATSAGAIVGGGFAYVGDIDTCESVLLDWFDKVRWRRDMNPPSISLLTGRLITEAFQTFFGDAQIEDLKLDFVAVSCDLTSAAPYAHTDGPLWRAIRASAAVPGIFPPVAIDGRVLVDGGLVANLPVEIARQRHPGSHITAVEVGDPTGIEVGDMDGSGIASGWRLPFSSGGAGPTLPRVMMRLTELGRHDGSDQADALLMPDVAGFGLTDTRPARDIIVRGYEATRAAIEAGELSV